MAGKVTEVYVAVEKPTKIIGQEIGFHVRRKVWDDVRMPVWRQVTSSVFNVMQAQITEDASDA